jgi:hypothetical protein
MVEMVGFCSTIIASRGSDVFDRNCKELQLMMLSLVGGPASYYLIQYLILHTFIPRSAASVLLHQPVLKWIVRPRTC